MRATTTIVISADSKFQPVVLNNPAGDGRLLAHLDSAASSGVGINLNYGWVTPEEAIANIEHLIAGLETLRQRVLSVATDAG